MLIQIFERQEEKKAKKEYNKNISKISDLDDICTVIDELTERINNVECEYKDKFVQKLKDIKFDVIVEIQSCESSNLEIMEIWEEESEEW